MSKTIYLREYIFYQYILGHFLYIFENTFMHVIFLKNTQMYSETYFSKYIFVIFFM